MVHPPSWTATPTTSMHAWPLIITVTMKNGWSWYRFLSGENNIVGRKRLCCMSLVPDWCALTWSCTLGISVGWNPIPLLLPSWSATHTRHARLLQPQHVYNSRACLARAAPVHHSGLKLHELRAWASANNIIPLLIIHQEPVSAVPILSSSSS